MIHHSILCWIMVFRVFGSIQYTRGKVIDRCTSIFFFFSAYQSIKDRRCFQEVSPSISFISQRKGYILVYLFKLFSVYYINPWGSWSSSGLFIVHFFREHFFLLVVYPLSKCIQTTLVVYS